MSAQIEAVRFLGELLAEDGKAFWKDGVVCTTVSDASGLTLFRLDLTAIPSASRGGGR